MSANRLIGNTGDNVLQTIEGGRRARASSIMALHRPLTGCGFFSTLGAGGPQPGLNDLIFGQARPSIDPTERRADRGAKVRVDLGDPQSAGQVRVATWGNRATIAATASCTIQVARCRPFMSTCLFDIQGQGGKLV